MAEQKEMLKPDNPAWAKLIADIKAVLSSRGDDGYAFTSLHRSEQWDFFGVSGFSERCLEQGMTEAQATAVIRNALDGKPQEKWLDGVFDGLAFERESKDLTNDRSAYLAGASLQGRRSAANETYETMLDQAAKRSGNAKAREQEQER